MFTLLLLLPGVISVVLHNCNQTVYAAYLPFLLIGHYFLYLILFRFARLTGGSVAPVFICLMDRAIVHGCSYYGSLPGYILCCTVFMSVVLGAGLLAGGGMGVPFSQVFTGFLEWSP